MVKTIEESLLEQVQCMKSMTEGTMVSHTEQDDNFEDFMQPSPHTEQEVVARQPVSIEQRPPDVQVDVEVHEAFESPDSDENSVEVVQEHVEAQVDGEDAREDACERRTSSRH